MQLLLFKHEGATTVSEESKSRLLVLQNEASHDNTSSVFFLTRPTYESYFVHM